MRKILLLMMVLLFAIVIHSEGSLVEASPTYEITPQSNTYKGKYNDYTSLNKYTKHYYVIRSYLEHLEQIGGGTLELDRGTYTITNVLYVPSNVTIKLNNGVKIVKGTKTGTRVGSRAGEPNIKPAKSLFQFVSPSKANVTGAYGKYNGERNISLIGSGNATIDLDFIRDSLAIIAGHNRDILIENITFKNMNSGHFIEIDATKDATIRNNKFMYSKPSVNYVKEAINIDTPDRSTLGWSSEWSQFDKTPNSNMLIENNTFYDLDRAIGTHKYSGNKYHDRIVIKDNKIDKMRSDPIRVMNWSNSIIEGNFIKNVSPSDSNNNRGILASGAVNPTFYNNVFVNVPRAMQFMVWKNSGPGSQYDTTYNDLSKENINALKMNTIVNGVEDFIRINSKYQDYSQTTTDFINIKAEPFYDLLPGQTGYEEILQLVDQGTINGYDDHSFKPHENISRQHVAVLLQRALKLDIPKDIQRGLQFFLDVTTNHEYAEEIAAVASGHIFQGSYNKFNPDNHITRGQMASVIVRAFDLKDNGKPVRLIDLNDISITHRNNVKILAQNGVTEGKVNDQGQYYFDVNGDLTRAQFSLMLYRALMNPEE